MRGDPRGHLRPSRRAARWSLAVAGTWSLFLSLLVVGLPHVVTDALVRAIGAYALGFGASSSSRPSTTPPARLRPRCLDGANPSAPAGLAPEQAPDPAAETTT